VFSPAETSVCSHLISLALEEDLSQEGDVTSKAIFSSTIPGKARFVARAAGVLAGLPAAELTFHFLDETLRFDSKIRDGSAVHPGQLIADVTGPMLGILAGERTALNFLQRLSGVASQTRTFVDKIAGLPCQILDTRKTTPGWRLLEKYAVRMGGGHNHRLGLYDGILIKDNHLAALGPQPAAVGRAVHLAREAVGSVMPIEVEVDTLEQLDAALAAGPDIILLDNMELAKLGEAVRRRNAHGRRPLLEASGGVHINSVRAIAETGVDRISVGALTHSAPALDIGLDYSK
jgi:nicotinate-nucleotide pyrophosphorylase (carboxylating)